MNLVVTIDNVEHAKSLMDKIKLLEHVTHVEKEEEFEIDAAILTMVEDRWNDYKKNPSEVISWKELKANLQKKHGF